MKKRYSEQQVIKFLKEAEAGVPVKELCGRHGFHQTSDSLRRSRCGGMDVPHLNFSNGSQPCAAICGGSARKP